MTVLKLWNVFTSFAALIEGPILATLSFCGILGVTCLVALMHDILIFIVSHVWFLYSIFSKIHTGQIYVTRSLWYLFRGKKKNELRRRVDTLEMTLDQQLVGTILFACILFLSLTPFVFYCFWGGVWLSVLFVHAILWLTYSFICTLPLYEIYLYLFNSQAMLPGSIRFTVSQYDVNRNNRNRTDRTERTEKNERIGNEEEEEEEDSSNNKNNNKNNSSNNSNGSQRKGGSRMLDNYDRNNDVPKYKINKNVLENYDRNHGVVRHRSKGSGSGHAWGSRELFDTNLGEEYNTSYLHLNGNSVSFTTLFHPFNAYFKCWTNHYSIIKFIREFYFIPF